jgi:hypothetical protein
MNFLQGAVSADLSHANIGNVQYINNYCTIFMHRESVSELSRQWFFLR